MGRDLCRIVLGGNHCPFVYFDSFLAVITTFPKTLFAGKLYATLFRSTTSTRSRKCGLVGYVRRHGFIPPDYSGLVFHASRGTAVDVVSFRLMSL